MVTEEQIDELLILARKAHTPGCWAFYPRRKNAVKGQFLTLLNDEDESMNTWPGFVQASFEDDAHYIVAAANLAPELAKELRAAREEIKQLKRRSKN